MHMDEAGAMLWTGHADGRVCGFWLGGSPGSAINTRRKYSWQVCADDVLDGLLMLDFCASPICIAGCPRKALVSCPKTGSLLPAVGVACRRSLQRRKCIPG